MDELPEFHEKKLPLELKPADSVFAWCSIPVGFILVRAVTAYDFSLAAFLSILLLFAFGGIYLRVSGMRIRAESRIAAAACLILSLTFLTWGANAIQILLYPALILAFCYWMYDAAGLAGQGLPGKNFFLHLPDFVFLHPIRALGSIFPALRFHKSEAPRSRTLLWLLLGLAAAILPTALIINLLSYDESFSGLIHALVELPVGAAELFWELLFGFVMAIPVFGVLLSARERSEKTGGAEEAVHAPNLRVAPQSLLCAAVTPVLLVYVLFFFSQRGYYLSAFTGTLPKGLTYAGYAREGFFELCEVCAINAGMLALFNLLMKEKPGESGKSLLTKLYSTVIIVFTLILAVTALSKLGLYIGSYGLTRKRVCAAWLTILICAQLLLALAHQWIPKFPLVQASVICGFVFLCLLLIPNLDGWIADTNVALYLSGSLPNVDMNAMYELGVSAVPAVARLRDALLLLPERTEAEREMLKAAAGLLTDYRLTMMTAESLFRFTVPEFLARKILYP